MTGRMNLPQDPDGRLDTEAMRRTLNDAVAKLNATVDALALQLQTSDGAIDLADCGVAAMQERLGAEECDRLVRRMAAFFMAYSAARHADTQRTVIETQLRRIDGQRDVPHSPRD